MTRPGPPPTPTKILDARGSWRAKERKHEPQGPAGKPYCPRALVGDGRRLWRRVTKMLKAMRVLTLADEFAVARYCQLLSEWWTLTQFVATNGHVHSVSVTDTRDGKDPKTDAPYKTQLRGVSFREFPQVKIRERIGAELRQLEDRLGLTPSARARLVLDIEPQKKPDDGKRSVLRIS